MSQWWQILTRKKELDQQQINTTELGRVLNVFDLTLLGVGSTLGVGVYVLAGHVARDTAGPAVIISFLIAAIVSVFAGLCYAEFGARVPRAGSAYIYSYVSVGEIVAFIIGWNLILEYMIGSASVARAFTLYLDNLLGYKLNSTFTEIAPINVEFMSPYFDFLSFGITLVLGIGMAFGLKESKWVNNIFTLLNVAVVIFVISAGAYFSDINNWKLIDVPESAKNGGFIPFGIEGVFKGAATCFYGFVGFDCIATTGEEVKNPKRAIPISIIVSLFIIFLAYFGTSAVVTLMWPYYDLDPNSPIPYGFEKNDFQVGKWIVTIGAMFGLAASLFGAMFPLPRIIYAMAEDSLIFRFLGNVNKKFKTPVVGTLIAALLTGLMSALFDLKQLVNMMSIGTLLAYTIVAMCVLLLRYSLDEEEIADIKYSFIQDSDSSDYEYNDLETVDDDENSNLLISKKKAAKAVVKQMFNFKKKTPNHLTRKIINVQIIFFCILAILFGACMKWLIHRMVDLEIWALALTSVVVFFMVLTLCSISAQPSNPTKLPFKVPLVPLLPAISICFNIYLMLMLDIYTWIRFGVWMAIGLPIYLISACLYHNKKITKPRKKSLSEFSIQNGIINYTYVDEETVQESPTLTIVPEIVIQPATPQVSDKPENKQITLRKKYSIFERPITETELYKDLSKNITSNGNTPVHSPRNSERRISLIFSKEQNLGHVDTDTESESSQEHHVEVDVHREHDDEEGEKLEDSKDKQEEELKGSEDTNEVETFKNDNYVDSSEMNHDCENDKNSDLPNGNLSESEDNKSDGSHEEAINMLNQVIKEAESDEDKTRNASTVSLCSFEIESSIESGLDVDNTEESEKISENPQNVSEQSPEILDSSGNGENGGNDRYDPVQTCPGLGKCVTIEAETGELKKISKEEKCGIEILDETPGTSSQNLDKNPDTNLENLEKNEEINPENLGEIEGTNQDVEMEEKNENIPKENENDSTPNNEGILSPVPPPPPLPPTENYFEFTPPEIIKNAPSRPRPVTAPPLQITPNQIQNINLKKTPTVLKRQISDIDPDFNETVKGGTSEMKKIKDKLNEFYKDFKPPQTPVYKTQMSEVKPVQEPEVVAVVKPPSPEIITTTDEYAKSIDFKEKLGSLILKNSLKVKKNGDRKSAKVEAIDKEEHKKKMMAILNMESGKENKENKNEEEKIISGQEDSNKNNYTKDKKDSNKEDDNKLEDSDPNKKLVESKNLKNETPQESLEAHKKKMIGTLRSIKLRKTGILNLDPEESERQKTDQNITKPEDDNQNVSNNEKSIEEHKRKMIATFRSIKLRKTGILDIDQSGEVTNFQDKR